MPPLNKFTTKAKEAIKKAEDIGVPVLKELGYYVGEK